MEKNHLAIVLESMERQFHIILEGHSALANQIADFKQDTKERFDLVDLKFEAVSDRIDAVDEKLTKRIDAMAAELKATDARLSRKIDAVAADLKVTDERLTGVAADLKAHRADTEAHGGKGLYVVREE